MSRPASPSASPASICYRTQRYTGRPPTTRQTEAIEQFQSMCHAKAMVNRARESPCWCLNSSRAKPCRQTRRPSCQNGSPNRETAEDCPFARALPVAPVHDMVRRCGFLSLLKRLLAIRRSTRPRCCRLHTRRSGRPIRMRQGTASETRELSSLVRPLDRLKSRPSAKASECGSQGDGVPGELECGAGEEKPTASTPMAPTTENINGG